MGLGNFRKKAQEQEDELVKQHEHQMETKDDKGYSYGSIFIPNMIPEDMEAFNPKASEGGSGYIIDVIPFYAGKQHPYKPEGRLAYVVDLWVHRNVGAGNDMLVCQMKTGQWREPDPMCIHIKQTNLTKTQWKEANSKRRCAYFVWDHTTPEEEAKGLKYWEIAHFFFEKEVDDISKNPRGGGAIAWSHHDHGKSVAFTVTKGTYTDDAGQKQDSIEFSGFQFLDRLEPAIPDKILEQTFPLDEAINMHPTEEEWLKAFPEGGAVEDRAISQTSATEAPFGRDEKIPEKAVEEPEKEVMKCPIEGLTFGVNTGDAKECRTCDVYDSCFDAKSTSKEEVVGKGPEKEPEPEKEVAKVEEKKKPKLQRRRKK